MQDISITKSYRTGKAFIGGLTERGKRWVKRMMICDGRNSTVVVDLEAVEDIIPHITGDGLTYVER